jgi:DNA-binding NtrC family response regulator
MSVLLVVDQDADLCSDICNFFRTLGHSAFSARDFASALSQLEQRTPDVVLSSVAIPGGTVTDLIRAVKRRNRDAAVIVSTELGTAGEGILAAQEGAFGILHKPFSIPELNFQIKRALEGRGQKSATPTAPRLRDDVYQPYNFIGESPEIKKVFGIVSRVAKTDSNVLIVGETGTGKELVAGAIHYNSPRAGGPFVRVNCAALPEQLLESELFGYEKGAFTGADSRHQGRFEFADRGTIFLDEVADMSPYTQAKVLRVIQEKEFERLGSNVTVKSDVRIISATNKDLMTRLRQNLFREDLYYRLNVIAIRLPPLRERGSDVALLVQFFVKRFAADMNKRITGIEPGAVKLLSEYNWPGNIRELENTIERAVLLAEGNTITREDIDLFMTGRTHGDDGEGVRLPAGGVSLAQAEKDLVLQALEQCAWVQKKAAMLLGVSSRTLNYKIKHHGITHPSWRQNR